jgi:predicted DNA-binding antitoxin AbrB/MazE fold protein
MTIAAKYENGVFKLLEAVTIEEGTVVEVHIPARSGAKRGSIRDLAFTGMWAYRDDIKDGVSYVSSLRDDPRGLQNIPAAG